MPPTGSIFTDWQQVERESRLLIDEDFSWSEPPARSRRRIVDEPIRARRRGARVEPEPLAAAEPLSAREPWDPPTQAHSHFDEMMAAWNAAYGDGAAVIPPGDDDAAASAADDGYDNVAYVEHDLAGYDDVAYVERDLAGYADAIVREDHSGRFDLSDPGLPAGGPAGRRTVVITGRGDDRYMPAPRRRPSSSLRFHERTGFSPDRAGLWAVLLGIALLIGCVVH